MENISETDGPIDEEIAAVAFEEPEPEIAPEGGDQDEGGTPEPAVTPQLSGDQFARFWGVDVWDATAGIGGALLRTDLSAVKTPAEAETYAIGAGEALERICDRYPRFLGWMKSPFILEGSDAFVVLGFFGGKVKAIADAVQAKKAGKAPSSVGTVPNDAEAFRAAQKAS